MGLFHHGDTEARKEPLWGSERELAAFLGRFLGPPHRIVKLTWSCLPHGPASSSQRAGMHICMGGP